MDAPQPTNLPDLLRHSRFDDAQAIFSGTLFVAIAMMLFGQAGLLTGGTAGVAFILHYATGVSFGKLFFLVNLPFYWFAWRHMGRAFTLKTFSAIALLSVMTDWAPRYLSIDSLHPAFAAVLGGLLLGTGCLFLARHRASLGGATVLTLPPCHGRCGSRISSKARATCSTPRSSKRWPAICRPIGRPLARVAAVDRRGRLLRHVEGHGEADVLQRPQRVVGGRGQFGRRRRHRRHRRDHVVERAAGVHRGHARHGTGWKARNTARRSCRPRCRPRLRM
jgi:hypothetical protein